MIGETPNPDFAALHPGYSRGRSLFSSTRPPSKRVFAPWSAGVSGCGFPRVPPVDPVGGCICANPPDAAKPLPSKDVRRCEPLHFYRGRGVSLSSDARTAPTIVTNPMIAKTSIAVALVLPLACGAIAAEKRHPAAKWKPHD